MKISVWQQFSSNHSANFTILGTFGSYEQAAQAAEEVRAILRDIAVFWRDLSPEANAAWQARILNEMTPVEAMLSQLYEIGWCRTKDGLIRGLDWVPPDPALATEAIHLFGKNVVVKNVGDTGVGSSPFEVLLQKWGASAVIGSYEIQGRAIGVTITCLAPDEMTAEKLLSDIEVKHQYIAGNRPYRYLTIAGHIDVSDRGDVRRDGLKMTYPLVDVGDVTKVFPALLDYLRENGCTEIEYTFHQYAGG